ncbi:DUF3115 domain-containing protein [Colletotrichum scovillei]|uniref:DUF3115 domain-containing protein n=2 Tax=Colletotrichum scovillei TaxID=1209932 RepID=A0A9P7RC92_9PEZI|nr:DUF3115 domain-containing protein [Colletotrichum scovillei]KAG7074135.1 DUF3115 domain-containing protein [Colletotrichum scovillei]KAG7081334.1 DUF3115 domain-containing protein [Colletotrichum scovillei]
MKVEHNIRDTSHHAANSKKTTGKPAKQQKAKPKAQPESQGQAASSSSADNANAVDVLPLIHQQRLLASFASAFQPVLASPAFATILQEVKAALYARDFDAAFTSAKPESLDAYAARWSPTRALAYAVVLLGIAEHLEGLEIQVKKAEDEAGAEGAEVAEVSEGLQKLIVEDKTGDAPRDQNSSSPPSTDDQEIPPAAEDDAVTPPPPASEPSETTTTVTPRTTTTQIKKEINILSIGGGAAELAALAAYLSQQPAYLKGTITCLDAAPWAPVVSKLHAALTVPPPASRYANEAQATAAALVEPAARLSSSFSHLDALAMSRDQLSQTMGKEALLITLLFTLNELYTAAGIGKTTAFLLNLTATVPLGSLLLVVDSPGSYSEAAVGKESKKYPMQWLMDHTLVNKPQKDGVFPGCRWEKVESNDSVWFRLAESLNYPIPLENMRYQMHLYRATKP